MSKRNRPSYQNRSHRSPSRDPDLKTDYVGEAVQFLSQQLSGLAALLQSPLSSLAQSLRSSLPLYGIWLASTLFPFWEDGSFLANYPQSLAILPLLLSLAILIGSAFDIQFPLSSRVPRIFWNLFLFPLPFLQEANVSGKRNRPYWTCLGLWDGILIFISALNLGHFTMAITAPVVVVLSFSVLLFR